MYSTELSTDKARGHEPAELNGFLIWGDFAAIRSGAGEMLIEAGWKHLHGIFLG